jgi:hypothetical protein
MVQFRLCCGLPLRSYKNPSRYAICTLSVLSTITRSFLLSPLNKTRSKSSHVNVCVIHFVCSWLALDAMHCNTTSSSVFKGLGSKCKSLVTTLTGEL